MHAFCFVFFATAAAGQDGVSFEQAAPPGDEPPSVDSDDDAGERAASADANREDSESEDAEEDEEGGVQSILPVFRLAFGSALGFEPSGQRGFTFDLAGGVRLLLREGKHHPTLIFETGYSRRGGDFGTHDMLFAAGAGWTGKAVGIQLVETITFATQVGRHESGIRTGLRLELLMGIVGVEMAHQVTFRDPDNAHEFRVQAYLDVGLIIGVVSVLRALKGITRR